MSIVDAPLLVVACVGAAFLPGTRESYEMAATTFLKATGQKVVISVLRNLTVLPPLGLGAMRNFAILQSLLELKPRFVMLIDNDVLFDDPEILLKLTSHNQEFVTPWFDQSPIGKRHRIHAPMLDKGQGLLEIKWTVPYCVLWRVTALNRLGPQFYTETMIYNEDEFNCLRFRFNGVKIMQDTNSHVTLLRPPGLLADTLGKLRVLLPGENP